MGWSDSLDNPTLVTVGGTGNLPATNEIPVDMHPSLLSAYTQLTPLTVILARNSEDPTFNFRIDWMEKKEIPTTVIVATTESSAGTTVTVVDNGPTLVKDTLLYNPDKDDLRIVDSTPSGNAVTVTISQGGKTSSAWEAGDIVHVLLPAVAENDTDGTTRVSSVANENLYNYVQLCKLQFAITRLEDAMKTYFGGRGSKREELRQQKYREYRIKKEKMLYFGGRATGGTAPASKRMMGGLNHFLRDGTLFKDFGGYLTESGFRNLIGDYKDQNPESTRVMVFTAGNVCDIVSDFGGDKVRLSPDSKVYGLDIMRYRSRGIEASLVSLPLLDVGVTDGWGWILDMERVMLKKVDSDTFYPHDRNAGAGEIMYDTYRGVYSLIVANESKHAMFVGARH